MSIGRQMDKEMWHTYTMEYYTAIKQNRFESGLMRWMNLEAIIQSEVSQKKKGKYCMLTHLYGIYKNGTNDPTCRAAKET